MCFVKCKWVVLVAWTSAFVSASTALGSLIAVDSEATGTNIALQGTAYTGNGELAAGFGVGLINDGSTTTANAFITDQAQGSAFSYGISWKSAVSISGLSHFGGYQNRDDGMYTVAYTTDAAAMGLTGANINTASFTWLPLITGGTFSINNGGGTNDGNAWPHCQPSYFSGDSISGVTAIRIISTNWDGEKGSVAEVRVFGTVPEPATGVSLMAAVVGLLAYAWRKRK